MSEAGIPNAIRTILIIVVAYYIVKYAIRLFMATKVRSSANGKGQRQNGTRQEGDVTIEYLDKEENKGQRNDGAEPVDFEEVED